jgi:hypothetical protein
MVAPLGVDGLTAGGRKGWRTPAVILVCGCAIGVLGFGPRSALGFFLTPISAQTAGPRRIRARAFAINAAWVPAVLRRALADRFGAAQVLGAGGVPMRSALC